MHQLRVYVEIRGAMPEAGQLKHSNYAAFRNRPDWGSLVQSLDTALRAGLKLSSQLELVLRLNNSTDESVADRADFAGGNYRYLPGRGRELFADIRYSPLRSP